MNPTPPANVRARIALALLALLPACRSPLGGRELDLSFTGQAFPGAGAGVALAQKLVEQGDRRFDFELGLERQTLSDEGPDGDDWTRIFAGLRCAALEPGTQLQGRLGVTWLRSEGETDALPDPGDYGGGYLGTSYSWELGPALATGPDLTLLWVDSEGDISGSGLVAEFAWRWTWHL